MNHFFSKTHSLTIYSIILNFIAVFNLINARRRKITSKKIFSVVLNQN